MIRVFVDGASNPNKENSSVGVLIIEDGKQTQIGKKLDGFHENHQTEYFAFLYALELLLKDHKNDQLVLCHSDSKMLVDAVNKRFTSNDKYKELLSRSLELVSRFSDFHIKWVPEKNNKGAHQLAKNALYSNKKSQ
ncbi:ribonuclease HI family protein [Jeotgalibaca ciconiae]|uniref:Ribonuclease HI family protein n=1 Tax=Jeotgalibaca ciconiae TaxID=2496265 RepID=A0A3Q9BM51_9LACT|nr:ribonuclease HI family protein [Jeotgalibaca ciconiae]AZP05473.1 ribonuclease HI family protein [Jeotgalibaca ciconiae]HJB24181.1 ribonuclease HI family protein [Candidatus Jeotgalibaca pullicola]